MFQLLFAGPIVQEVLSYIESRKLGCMYVRTVMFMSCLHGDSDKLPSISDQLTLLNFRNFVAVSDNLISSALFHINRRQLQRKLCSAHAWCPCCSRPLAQCTQSGWRRSSLALVRDSLMRALIPAHFYSAHFHHLLTGSQLIPTCMCTVLFPTWLIRGNSADAVFQFAYSSLFGMFSAFAFVRTGVMLSMLSVTG